MNSRILLSTTKCSVGLSCPYEPLSLSYIVFIFRTWSYLPLCLFMAFNCLKNAGICMKEFVVFHDVPIIGLVKLFLCQPVIFQHVHLRVTHLHNNCQKQYIFSTVTSGCGDHPSSNVPKTGDNICLSLPPTAV